MTDQATVLIVDDEPKNCRLLELLLHPEGYRTVIAGSGEEALAAVTHEVIDLIILDVRMPEMDGYQVAKVLKADTTTRNIPIIMITALLDRASRLAGLEAGVEEFLTLPIERTELWLRARNLVRLKKYTDLLEDQAAELELRVQERSAELQRFRLAMDATADAIYLVSRSTMRLVEFNATAEKLSGYAREDLLQMAPWDLGGPPGAELEAIFDRLIAGTEANVLLQTEVKRKDGSVFAAEVQLHVHRSADEWVMVGVLRDITQRKATETALHHLAHYDTLTGLPNRALFYETLEQSVASATSNGWTLAVMFLDIDHFKNVNDTLGHAAGDELLIQVADRLVQSVRLRDSIGRLGGDEFALILLMEEGHDGVNVAATKILSALSKPFDVGGHEVSISASIGITVHPHDAADADTLLKYADTAMYQAKQAGRNTFRFFTPQMNTDLLDSLELARALRDAIDRQEFVLHYQPKLALSTGTIVGVEALLRWDRPGHGLVAPNDFIPVLESTGLILEVGTWVIQQACRQIAAWAASDVGEMRIAVNVASQQFVSGNVDGDVAAALLTSGVPGRLLELELTESSLLINSHSTIKALETVRACGVQLSIDDFGTGYSSLAYLRHFPIDKLKIDVAFIRRVTDDADDAAMARTIIGMARSLRLEVIAEGVETAAQLAFLSDQGCDQVQGYFVSRPLPAADLEGWLKKRSAETTQEVSIDRRTTLLLVDEDLASMTALEGLLSQDGYRILTASSTAAAFDVLTLHQVHAVLCDEEMRVHTFFSKVRKLHPGALRIMLSAGTDSGTVINAFNRGTLHGYYTKPWQEDYLLLSLRDLLRCHQSPREKSMQAKHPDWPRVSDRRPLAVFSPAAGDFCGGSTGAPRTVGRTPSAPGLSRSKLLAEADASETA